MKTLENPLLLILITILYVTSMVHSYKIHQIQPGTNIAIIPNIRNGEDFEIFCYQPKPKYLVNIWQTLFIKINSKSIKELFDGNTAEEVITEHEARRSSWRFNLFAKSQIAKIDPFKPSCLGVESIEPYEVEMHTLRIDYWKVILLVSGILLFLSATKLSETPLFYYICGITFGECASFLILVYFVSKIFPRKPMMYGFIVGGWSVGVYLFQKLFDNIRSIAVLYQSYIIYYVIATGVISFAICYRWGPPTDKRSKNLIKWTLMSAGLLMIYCSSYFTEAVLGIIVMLVIAYNFPRMWISKTRTLWKRRFPPKASLLSNEEYYQQGVKETCKALEELREYCSSPKCNQWKTVLKLKDAKRFASFIEGESHLSDNEVLDYENEQSGYNFEEFEDEEFISEDDL